MARWPFSIRPPSPKACAARNTATPAAQAQKEAFVNEALARIDVLLHPVVKGSTTAPPSNPQAGECWVVAATASDAWSEREDMLACWDGEQWTFCQPLAGMHVYNADSGEEMGITGMNGSGPNAPMNPPVGQSSMHRHAQQLSR